MIFLKFRLVDRDNNGLLDLEEFIDIVEGNVGKFETDSDLARLFELFDSQKTGFISLDSLEEIIRAFDNSLNEADLKEIAKRVDSDNDKRISINGKINILMALKSTFICSTILKIFLEFIKFMRG